MGNRGLDGCHPAAAFAYFVCVICFGVTVTHPAYTAAGILCGGGYYALLKGRDCVKTLLGLVPVFCLITFVNPLLNVYGITPLFYVFGRKYTLEALCYGASLGGIFVLTMLWFGCYSAVMTEDKFTDLFGSRFPGLSLLLVMILRMIPAFTRKVRQILDARSAVGKGVGQNAGLREKLACGAAALSSLTDWALEGSIVTADSMRARGYGTGRRTKFRRYRLRPGDLALLALIAALTALTLVAGGMNAAFTTRVRVDSLTWGFGTYCVLLLLPLLMTGKEALEWRSLRSKI